MSTFNKPGHLRRVLDSIARQTIPFSWECIVVDDGSANTRAKEVCSGYSWVRCIRIEREPVYRNAAAARNVALRAARGDVIILQPDDVEHQQVDTVKRLVEELGDTVHNVDPVTGEMVKVRFKKEDIYQHRDVFYLGSVRREHVCAVGGHDERFQKYAGVEDIHFVDCLENHLGLRMVRSSAIGHHLCHAVRADSRQTGVHARTQGIRIRRECTKTGQWTAEGGPWEFSSGKPCGVSGEDDSEGRFDMSRGNEDCRKDVNLWHADYHPGTENEVLDFIAGCVRALQPELVVETGTAYGSGAIAIGKALKRNGHGRLVTLETSNRRLRRARRRCKRKRLPVECLLCSSLDWEPDGVVDMLYLDSKYSVRLQEFEHFRKHMNSSTFIIWHDTGKQLPMRSHVDELERKGWITAVHLPTPRGVTLSRVL